jgi:hypothetical protein
MIDEEIDWIVKNWYNIDSSLKVNLKPAGRTLFIENLSEHNHEVIMLMDRQKPSVQVDYSYDEERIGVTKTGAVVWGFDSGCSCPTPWEDNYPDCYAVSRTWKEFIVNINEFDSGVIEECLNTIKEIKERVQSQQTKPGNRGEEFAG